MSPTITDWRCRVWGRRRFGNRSLVVWKSLGILARAKLSSVNPGARVFPSWCWWMLFHFWDDAWNLSVTHRGFFRFFQLHKIIIWIIRSVSVSVISWVLVPWKCLLFLCLSLFVVGTWMHAIIPKIAIGSASSIETSLSCFGALGCIAEPALVWDLEAGCSLIWVTVWIVLCKTLHVVPKSQRLFPAEKREWLCLALAMSWRMD